jgi:succinyl-CoA synthetase beta subunit
MARVAITEYAAKKLVFGDTYTGVTVTRETMNEAVALLPANSTFIIKIDVGIKKRGKQGLIRLNIPNSAVEKAALELFALGHERCVIEEIVPHETADERYISIDLGRDGAQVLYSQQGGVEIEENHEAIERFFIPRAEVLAGTTTVVIEDVPLNMLLNAMQQSHLSFMEINPFLLKNKDFIALDMAVEIDDTKASKLPAWTEDHLIKNVRFAEEQTVAQQDEMTTAALTLKILNKNGSILTLLSGGGASLVTMDALVTAGLQENIINYSEYSGAPTRDETATYVSTLLQVLFASESPTKVILIAGGVANFTDIVTTFAGIIDALSLHLAELQKQNIYVCVRRGGPNQEKGLASLRDFLTSNNIQNDVYDPSLSLGGVGNIIASHL